MTQVGGGGGGGGGLNKAKPTDDINTKSVFRKLELKLTVDCNCVQKRNICRCVAFNLRVLLMLSNASNNYII